MVSLLDPAPSGSRASRHCAVPVVGERPEREIPGIAVVLEVEHPRETGGRETRVVPEAVGALAGEEVVYRRVGVQAQRVVRPHVADVVAAAREGWLGLAPLEARVQRNANARRAGDGSHAAHDGQGPEVTRAAEKARREIGDLNALAGAGTDWKLESAVDINDSGAITGYGDYREQEDMGFLLVPQEESQQTPAKK